MAVHRLARWAATEGIAVDVDLVARLTAAGQSTIFASDIQLRRVSDDELAALRMGAQRKVFLRPQRRPRAHRVEGLPPLVPLNVDPVELYVLAPLDGKSVVRGLPMGGAYVLAFTSADAAARAQVGGQAASVVRLRIRPAGAIGLDGIPVRRRPVELRDAAPGTFVIPTAWFDLSGVTVVYDVSADGVGANRLRSGFWWTGPNWSHSR